MMHAMAEGTAATVRQPSESHAGEARPMTETATAAADVPRRDALPGLPVARGRASLGSTALAALLVLLLVYNALCTPQLPDAADAAVRPAAAGRAGGDRRASAWRS